MAAVAISQQDEKLLIALQKALRAPSKSQVIHKALETLQKIVAREKLAKDIQESVEKCDEADQKENEWLIGGAAFYNIK